LQQTGPASGRRRDPRRGWIDLVSAVAEAALDRADFSKPRAALEDVLRRLLPIETIQLRDQGIGTLETTLLPGSAIDEWSSQVLDGSAHLAVLLLELERCRQQSIRATGSALVRPRRDGAAPLIGRTASIRDLRARIERIASTDFIVLLEGESGVGKELVARQIHDLSRRRHGPFVAINCAALVETLVEAELFGIEDRTATGVRGRRGKFEHADGGTLFLDEVSDLSLSAQAKLLRAVQDLAVERVGGQGAHRVDIRIIAATNRTLDGLVERRLFRPDLFFRLSGVEIRVPPLRERRADILELARYFLERHRAVRSLRLSTAAADALVAYDWPGNVRELERLMERTIALAASDVVELDDLPACVRGDLPAAVRSLGHNRTMRAWGSRYARLVFEQCDSNKREACRVLGISYHTLNAYLRYPFADPPTQPDGDGGDPIEEVSIRPAPVEA
jgi:transcriptional regulator with PAS, ATPase and Fis domain